MRAPSKRMSQQTTLDGRCDKKIKGARMDHKCLWQVERRRISMDENAKGIILSLLVKINCQIAEGIGQNTFEVKESGLSSEGRKKHSDKVNWLKYQ